MKKNFLTVCIAGFIAFSFAFAVVSQATSGEKYDFVALADTSYQVPEDDILYKELIDVINAASPKFSIHLGDTKGYGDCGNEFQMKQRHIFASFENPVVYAYGNNEWAECWRANRNSGDPVAILDNMRQIFNGEAASMGKNKMPVARQSDQGTFSKYAENVTWHTEDVSFATINLTGSYNNMNVRDEALWREFMERELANIAWLETVFENAVTRGDKGLIIAFHSDIFDEALDFAGGPFRKVLDTIKVGATKFKGQVLVIHGHHHEFIVDKPIRVWDNAQKTSIFDNVTRLQVYGWPDMKAVRISVDTETPWIFGFEPLYGENSINKEFENNKTN
jgi:hypothetical protein